MYAVVHSQYNELELTIRKESIESARPCVRNLYFFTVYLNYLKHIKQLSMNILNRVCTITKIYGVRHTLRIKPYPCRRPRQITNGENFSTNTICRNKSNDGIFKTIISKIPFLNLAKTRLKVTGYLLYESVADHISYAEFFKKFSLPDTFYSWFVVTELHVWMLLVRTMAEGEDGRFTRNAIVQALWADVNTRAKKLGAANPSGIRMQVDELSQQFQATLVAYDEGLLTNDKILANALWRRFFQQSCECSEDLEFLVQYVRKQIKLLDDLSKDELLEKRSISWISMK